MGSRFVSPQTNSPDVIALVGAVAAIALTILALVGIAPRTLTAIAAICTGAALLGHGALITRRVFALRAPVGATFEQAKLGETASDEVLGGACTIALGVLALIGIEPLLLLGIAAIAIGGALAMSGPTREKLPHLTSMREKYATLRATQTGPKHRARRRKNRKTQARAKTRTVSRLRIKKVEANSMAHKPRKKSPRRQAAAPKSLTELLAELPPKNAESADVEPLFEPELLAAAHANAEFADTTMIGRAATGDEAVEDAASKAVPMVDVAPPASANVEAAPAKAVVPSDVSPAPAMDSDLVAAAVASQAEPPETVGVKCPKPVVVTSDDTPVENAPELATAHEAEAEPTEVPPHARRQQTARRGGLLSAVASALGKAKELKHKLDAHLEAHPIEHRGSRVETHAEPHALVKVDEGHALVKVEEPGALMKVEEREVIADDVAVSVSSDREELAAKTATDTHVSFVEREIEHDLQIRAAANAVKHEIEHEQRSLEGERREPHVLKADGAPYQSETKPIEAPPNETRYVETEHVDKTVKKALDHELDALVEARHLVHDFAARDANLETSDPKLPAVDEVAARDHEAPTNKKLEAEKVRESDDTTVDRHDGAAGIDAAYQREATARALELQHELEHHLESERLEHREQLEHPHDEHDDSNDDKRAKIAEVEPVPTTNAEIHRERALFLGGAVWVVGGFAAVVLGILALAGVARPYVLVEVAFLCTAASILFSSLANGARALASHDEQADDVEDDKPLLGALHARASERSSVSLHR